MIIFPSDEYALLNSIRGIQLQELDIIFDLSKD